MWIKSTVLLCCVITALAVDEHRPKKKDDARGKRNLQYSISHHYNGPLSYRADRRISTGSPIPSPSLYHPQFFPGPIRSYSPYHKGRPRSLPPPPYAVQMEPLVQYSQRDPLYETNILSLNTDGQPEDLLTDNNHLSENVYGPQKHIVERPVYIKEPEPIIEIIIKESNVTLPPTPTPPPQPKKKEQVQVFYVKYKKNPHGHGKDSIIYEKPVPAISPPIHDELEEEPPQEYHHQEHITVPPPPSTTLRTIIRPDSETYHSPSGVKVTFGKEGFDYEKRSSKPEDFKRSESTSTQFPQARQLSNFPPNLPRRPFNYNFNPGQRQPQPYRPFNQPPQFRPEPTFPRPNLSSQYSTLPKYLQQQQPKIQFPPQRPAPPQFHQQPRQPVPYQPFESLRIQPQPQPKPQIQFRPQSHFPITQQPPVEREPAVAFNPYQNAPVQHDEPQPQFVQFREPPQFRQPQFTGTIQTQPNHQFREPAQQNQQPTHQFRESVQQNQQPNQFREPVQQNQQPNHQFRETGQQNQQPNHQFRETVQQNEPPKHQFRETVQQNQQPNQQFRETVQQNQQPNHQFRETVQQNQPQFIQQLPTHQTFAQPQFNPNNHQQNLQQLQSQNILPPGGELIHSVPKYEQHISISSNGESPQALPLQHPQQNQAPANHLSEEEYRKKIEAQFREANALQESIRHQTANQQQFFTLQPSQQFQSSFYQTTPKPTTYSTTPTTTTTTTSQPSTTTKDPKELEAQLPDEVPEDLRAQLLSSGILNNAQISILDYDKVGDTPLSALPADQLANFFNAGGAQQIASSEPQAVYVDKNGGEVDPMEPEEAEASEIHEVRAKPNVEMKVVRYDPQTERGQQVQESYVKNDATQVDPVILNDQSYNRYLPLKVSGAQFPIPDVPELKGKKISSVVVLAPVAYDFSGTRKTRQVKSSDEIDLIQGAALKELLKNPTLENYKKFLDGENKTRSDKQAVILLVTSPTEANKDKEIFMYDIATRTVNKLSGELSAAFVEAAEANASDESPDTKTASSNYVETRIPFSGEQKLVVADDGIENSDDFADSNVPIIDPMDGELEGAASEHLESFIDISGMPVEEDLSAASSEIHVNSDIREVSKTGSRLPSP